MAKNIFYTKIIDILENIIDAVNGFNNKVDNNVKNSKADIKPITADVTWKQNTTYVTNNVVGYGNSVYVCLVDHTSTNNFDADYVLGYWSKIEVPKVNANGYVQAFVMGITGSTSKPYIKTFAINNTKDFILPPIEILEQKVGVNKIINNLHFNNADADDFDYNANNVVFDGTMHMKTQYEIPMSMPQSITDGITTMYISESSDIDFGDYKTVEKVVMQ